MSSGGLSWDSRQKLHTNDSFRNELREKLKQRHSMGMTVDLSTTDDDESDGGDEHPDDFISQFFPKSTGSKVSKEKCSSIGDTTKHSFANLTRRMSPLDHSLDSIEDDTYKNKIDFLNHPSSSTGINENILPQTSKRFVKSSNAKNDDKIITENRDKKFLTKEDSVFGKKADDEIDHESKKQWTPPNFRKPDLASDGDQMTRSTSPATSKGRRTPLAEPLLGTISESPTPRARKTTSGSVDVVDTPTPRSRNASRGSLIGIHQQDVNLSQDDDKTEHNDDSKSDEKRNFAQGQRNRKQSQRAAQLGSPISREGSRTDTSAPLRASPPYKKDESVKDHRSKSPQLHSRSSTFKQQKSGSADDEKVAPTPVKRGSSSHKQNDVVKTPSILDFLTSDSSTEPVVKPRVRSPLKAESNDGAKVKRDTAEEGGSMGGGVTSHKYVDEEASSICEEVKEDPFMARESSNVNQKQASSGGKSETTEHMAANAAIDAVANMQNGMTNTMRYINPDQHPQKTISETKIVRHRPKPRYASHPGETTLSNANSFSDTVAIRNAVYTEWYREKSARQKMEAKEKMDAQSKEEEKQKKNRENKIEESQSSYKAWLNNKTKLIKAKAREDRLNAEKAREKECENRANKVKDSESSFKNWKEKKDSVIKESENTKRREETKKVENERLEKMKKREKNVELYESWKSNKDKIIRDKVSKEKEKDKLAHEQEKRDMRKKDKQARRLYAEWLIKKDIADKRNKDRSQFNGIQEVMPPWSPAG